MAKSVKLVICILGVLLLGSAVYAQQRAGTTIQKIMIRGNRRISEENCRYYIQSREGEPYNESQLDNDLRSLYKAGFFENIVIQETDGDTGKIITFTVKEKPLIRSIEYAGNKSFTESNILDAFKEKKVGLTVDSQYDAAKLRAAERVLKDLMVQNGKPLGTVRTDTETIPPASVRVRFVMDEGAKVRIGEIRFTGNRIFSEAQLKDALKLTKEHGVYTMFKGTDKYHKDKLDFDIDSNLKAFYKEHGYMQVQFGEPVVRIFEGPRGMIPMIRKTPEQFYIEIPIEAGDQYRLGKLEIKNCVIFPDCQVLANSFGMKKGDVVNNKRIKDTLEAIKKLYTAQGYINWTYIPEYNPDTKNKTMDLILSFEPDKRFYVRRIDFEGNTKTKDKVIRRELLLEEGWIFSSTLLDNSIMRLNQLGFFDKIDDKDYEVRPDDKTGLVDVSIKVKEKSQRSIGFTGGVSGISGSFLGVNYSDNNFLGSGDNLQISLMGGTRETNFMVSFTQPYFLDTRWNMGVSFFDQRFRYDTYSAFGLTNVSGNPTELFNQSTLGATVSLNRHLGRTLWSFGGSYTYQDIGINNIVQGFEAYALGQFAGFTPGSTTSAALANSALNGLIRSEFTPMLSYNSTNMYFNPSKGSSLNLSLAVSGGYLGGDFNMIRPTVEFRHFFPDKWLSHGRNVFGLRMIGSYIQAYGNSSVPFFDRFFSGGEDSIRGFDIRSVSPLAISSTPLLDAQGHPIIDLKTGLPAVTSNIIPVGGDTLGIFNFEYRVPIAGPLSMSAFYDAGLDHVSRNQSLGNFGVDKVQVIDVTNNQVRGSTGVELQFILPVVSAPFRLIFAYNPQILDTSVLVGTQTLHIKEPRHDIKFTVGRSF
jgi:outer membrane protein insertion porin family